MRLLAGCLVLALLLAGCGSGGGDGPGGAPSSSSSAASTSGEPAPYQVDGQAVYDWVAGVVTNPDGSPHFRVPGTADHAEAAAWLAEQMEVPGWTVAWQNFTGAEYQGIDKGGVRAYTQSCSDADRQRVAGLGFSNLVATLEAPGSERTFVLGAHWESKRHASQESSAALRSQPVLGANDGASGVGVLLQLMWELSGKDLPYTVQVVLFDGEDGFEDCHPLAGSLWFVHRLGEGDVDRMLLLDMVGDPDARFVRESHSEDCDPALVGLLHGKAARHGLAENFPGTRTSVLDDHVPFAEAGIPAVDLIDYGRGFPPYWHTTRDTMENLSPEMLGHVASLVLDVMQDPGFSEPWPGPC